MEADRKAQLAQAFREAAEAIRKNSAPVVTPNHQLQALSKGRRAA